MSTKDWTLLLTLALIWSGPFLFIEFALEGLSPFTIVALRVALGAAALHGAMRVAKLRLPRDARAWRDFAIMGLLNNALPFCLIVNAQTEITSGLTSIFNATTPIFTVVLAHYLTHDERFTPAKVFGIAAGVAGVIAMIGPDALEGLGANIMAQLAVCGASCSYALAGIFGRRFKGRPAMVPATGSLVCAALVMVPLALIVDRPWALPMPGPGVWASVLALALLCTALAYILYFKILASAGATNLMLVTLLIPPGAVVLGAIFLGESLAWREVAGMALIGIGLLAIDGRAFKWFARGRRASPSSRSGSR